MEVQSFELLVPLASDLLVPLAHFIKLHAVDGDRNVRVVRPSRSFYQIACCKGGPNRLLGSPSRSID